MVFDCFIGVVDFFVGGVFLNFFLVRFGFVIILYYVCRVIL